MGLFDDQEKGTYQEMKDDLTKNCKCSFKTRVMGWIICAVVGWIISTIASVVFIINHKVVNFAIFYSIGQVINITGSCFLSGPKTQFKDMTKRSRLLLTSLYVGSLIATLVLAFLLPQNLSSLVIITLVVQMISYFLYTLSFIPFGLKILKKTCACLFMEG